MSSRAALWVAGLTALQLAASTVSYAQGMKMPRPSPDASVTQTIGVTDVTIHYSRPGVKGREIWGKLVPYGQVWRTGANENTTISFSTPVKVEGHDLPAGTYGLHTIPTTPDQWTVIFSKDSKAWGSFEYKQENDALRVQVKPQPAELRERMGFDFEDVTDTSAKVVLRWEKLQVPFTVEADTPNLVTAAARESLSWAPFAQAAGFCIQSNSCLDDAARWLDASIALEPNFSNQRLKAMLLAKKNDFKGAASFGDKALAAAKTAQEPPSAQQLSDFEKMVADWKKK
jgi:hypothetical protein